MSFTAIDRERVRGAWLASVNVLNSAANLLGAAAVAGVGGLMISISVSMVRRPDAALLQQAMEKAAHSPPSPLEERDIYLGFMLAGAVILIMGLRAIEKWWRGTSPK